MTLTQPLTVLHTGDADLTLTGSIQHPGFTDHYSDPDRDVMTLTLTSMTTSNGLN